MNGDLQRTETADEVATLRLLVQHSPVAMGVANLAGRILYLNPTFLLQFGTHHGSDATVADLVRRSSLNAAEQQRALDYWNSEIVAKARTGLKPPDVSLQVEKDGQPRQVLLRFAVSGDKVITTFGDIDQLHRAQRVLEIQRDLASGLLHAPDQETAFAILLEAAVRLPGFDCGGVYARDELTGELNLVSHHGLSPAFANLVSRHPQDSPQARLVAEGTLVYLLATDLPPAVAASVAAEGLQALAIIPLRDGDRIIGALNVSCHRRSNIDPDSRIALENLSAQAESAIALVRARAARTRAEHQLHLAVDAAELGTWMVDFDSNLSMISPRTRQLHDVNVHEPLTPESPFAYIHPAHHAEIRAKLQHALATGEPFTAEYRTAGEPPRWLTSRARSFPEEGERRLYGIVRDITSAKLAEEQLIQSRDQLESKVSERTAALQAANAALTKQTALLDLALSASRAGVWSWDVGSNIVQADSHERTLLAFPEDSEVLLSDIMARIHPDDRQPLELHLAKACCPGKDHRWYHDFRIIHPLHGERWLAGIGRIERDAHGNAIRMTGINIDVSARKHAEAALRRSEEKYRKLHESMTDAFVSTAMDGRILETNRAYQEMLGYSADELLELTYFDLTPAKWHDFEASLVHDQILTRGYSDPYEKEYLRKDGTSFPVELRTFLLRDDDGNPRAMWAIVRDITQRKRAQQLLLDWNANLEKEVASRTVELQQSEARFRQLAEASFEGIAVTENGIVIDGNPQLADLLRCPLDHIIGRPVDDFVAPESTDLVMRNIRQGSETPYEFLAMRADGSQFPAEALARPLLWQGRLARVTVLRDLTTIRQSAELLQAQRIQLEKALRLALVSEVSAGILHQLAQPLSAATVNAAAAKARTRDCPIHQCGAAEIIHDIEAELTRAREAIDHLRRLAHPEQTIRHTTNLPALVAGVMSLVRDEASRHSVHLALHCPPPVPDILADPVQIEQVILNLLRNALEACSPPNSRRGKVHVTLKPLDPGRVEILVTDNGHGIPAQISHLLFQPFFTTKTEGTGIGLRLSQTIVTSHGGTIEGYNNPEAPGSTFRITLPVAPQS